MKSWNTAAEWCFTYHILFPVIFTKDVNFTLKLKIKNANNVQIMHGIKYDK